ncbi:MoxR family ATPase [Streptomyces sp. NPDC047197]|uniref:AAA family ATPase n=1 Tax=Streptomyces sp. NPDC047197 TaxID=3155477 RepID=UPI0033F77DDA
MTSDWLIYQGLSEPHDGITRLPPPPPWRAFDGEPAGPPPPVPALDSASTRRLGTSQGLFAARGLPDELELINAALYLRRPLLITGDPGTGKSTLAHSIAHELNLGRVLQWPVVSRSSLRDGLYQYDAIGRLQESQLPGSTDAGIGRYLRLGPLGTALLPSERPRVVLIDELDKGDVDLPNDLLNVLEEGEFSIPELVRSRQADAAGTVTVLTEDGTSAAIADGRVRCRAFPVVVMTSNDERDFPAPLLRRCIHLDIRTPSADRLASMVQAHFGSASAEENEDIIERFLSASPGGLRAADQLLNAIYLTQYSAQEDPVGRERLADLLMRPLGPGRP